MSVLLFFNYFHITILFSLKKCLIIRFTFLLLFPDDDLYDIIIIYSCQYKNINYHIYLSILNSPSALPPSQIIVI